MIVKITRIPCLYKKFYIEINDNGAKHTSVVTLSEAKEIKHDLKEIATITEL